MKRIGPRAPSSVQTTGHQNQNPQTTQPKRHPTEPVSTSTIGHLTGLRGQRGFECVEQLRPTGGQPGHGGGGLRAHIGNLTGRSKKAVRAAR